MLKYPVHIPLFPRKFPLKCHHIFPWHWSIFPINHALVEEVPIDVGWWFNSPYLPTNINPPKTKKAKVPGCGKGTAGALMFRAYKKVSPTSRSPVHLQNVSQTKPLMQGISTFPWGPSFFKRGCFITGGFFGNLFTSQQLIKTPLYTHNSDGLGSRQAKCNFAHVYIYIYI